MAVAAAGKFAYPTGREGAVALGYDPAVLREIGPEMLSSFCGVGNPFAIEPLKPGSVVLDVGCGAGFDLMVASRLTGPSGRVYGIDLTAEMVAKARAHIGRPQVANIEVLQVDSEEIPFADRKFDVVISNGVINLSPGKSDLFREIYRVLKRGGKLQFADIVKEREVPPGLTGSLDAWAQ